MFVKKNTRYPLLLLVVGLVILVGCSVYFFAIPNKTKQAPPTSISKPAHIYFSKLSGLPVNSQNEVGPQVVGVMIDNHRDARPPSRLGEADIVYEALAEGGITRYLALFSSNQDIDKVGPVRSARPYYLDWLAEYGDALYVHAGGSPEALREIKERGVFDANEFFRENYFWRDYNRLAPHNLYTSSANWQKLLLDYGKRRPLKEWEGWKFKDAALGDAANSTNTIKEVRIKYGTDYFIGWKFDPTLKKYIRYINGLKVADAQGNNILADNIIVQEMRLRVLDDAGRKEMDTIGTGGVRVLVRDELLKGKWQKKTRQGRTRFYNTNGEEIVLAPGKTWIEVVPLNTVMEVTK